LIIPLVQKYKTLTDFKNNEPSAYDACVRNGWIDELLGNLERKSKVWEKDEILRLTNNFEYLQDFKKSFPNAYVSAQRKGWSEELFSNLKQAPRKKRKWTYEILKDLTQKFDSIKSFKAEHPSAYSAILQSGWLDELTNHMTRERRTTGIDLESVLDIAKKYQSIGDFKKNDKNTYAVAQYHGWLPEVSKFLGRKNIEWTYEKVKNIVDKYETLKDFIQLEPNAYHAAQRNKWLEEITKNLKREVTKWTYDDFITLSEPYKEKLEFKRAFPKLYQVAYKWGWIKDKYK
jgi:hypothetical protein